MACSERDIQRLKELHAFLTKSFKGASVGALKLDDAVHSLGNALEYLSQNPSSGPATFMVYSEKIAWVDVVVFVGNHRLPPCDTCDGSGEYDGEYGPIGCQACNSRCFALKTPTGTFWVDWGDLIFKDNQDRVFYVAKDS